MAKITTSLGTGASLLGRWRRKNRLTMRSTGSFFSAKPILCYENRFPMLTPPPAREGHLLNARGPRKVLSGPPAETGRMVPQRRFKEVPGCEVMNRPSFIGNGLYKAEVIHRRGPGAVMKR